MGRLNAASTNETTLFPYGAGAERLAGHLRPWKRHWVSGPLRGGNPHGRGGSEGFIYVLHKSPRLARISSRPRRDAQSVENRRGFPVGKPLFFGLASGETTMMKNHSNGTSQEETSQTDLELLSGVCVVSDTHYTAGRRLYLPGLRWLRGWSSPYHRGCFGRDPSFLITWCESRCPMRTMKLVGEPKPPPLLDTRHGSGIARDNLDASQKGLVEENHVHNSGTHVKGCGEESGDICGMQRGRQVSPIHIRVKNPDGGEESTPTIFTADNCTMAFSDEGNIHWARGRGERTRQGGGEGGLPRFPKRRSGYTQDLRLHIMPLGRHHRLHSTGDLTVRCHRNVIWIEAAGSTGIRIKERVYDRFPTGSCGINRDLPNFKVRHLIRLHVMSAGLPSENIHNDRAAEGC